MIIHNPHINLNQISLILAIYILDGLFFVSKKLFRRSVSFEVCLFKLPSYFPFRCCNYRYRIFIIHQQLKQVVISVSSRTFVSNAVKILQNQQTFRIIQHWKRKIKLFLNEHQGQRISISLNLPTINSKNSSLKQCHLYLTDLLKKI